MRPCEPFQKQAHILVSLLQHVNKINNRTREAWTELLTDLLHLKHQTKTSYYMILVLCLIAVAVHSSASFPFKLEKKGHISDLK